MNIFVWVKYGYIEVYKAETMTELANIYSKIVAEINDWGLEADIAMMDSYVNNLMATGDHYHKAINFLLRKIEIGTNETFETGTGFSKLITI